MEQRERLSSNYKHFQTSLSTMDDSIPKFLLRLNLTWSTTYIDKLTNYFIDKLTNYFIDKLTNYFIDKLTNYFIDKLTNYFIDKLTNYFPWAWNVIGQVHDVTSVAGT